MRRLFWTFPDGLPGIGLVLLRVALSVALLNGAVGTWQSQPAPPSVVFSVVNVVFSAGLLVGFGTPFWAVGTAGLEGWRASSDPTAVLLHGLMAAVGAALALLGPGAVSVDARMFGWRRLDVRGPRR